MKTSYLANSKNKYIQTNNGDVYKIVNDHFLKMSPWNDGENRSITELDDDKYTLLSLENACMIVNKQFANTTEKWQHKNKHYIASSTANKDIKEHTYLLSTLPNHKFINSAEQLLNTTDTNSITIENGNNELKLIKHKGKIYYILIINEFLPRVKMYNTFGQFCQWCNIKHCKPVFCEEDNKYI